MENNNIGVYRKTCKLKQSKDNKKILRCLYFYKPNIIINKPKNGLKWHHEIKELIPDSDLVLGDSNCFYWSLVLLLVVKHYCLSFY